MGSHRFLTPEWIEAAMALREELAPAAPAARQEARVNLVVTDTPFGDGQFRAYIDTVAGGPLPLPGELDHPEATVTLDYPAALAAFVTDDLDAVAQGFLTGTLRVDGDLAPGAPAVRRGDDRRAGRLRPPGPGPIAIHHRS